MELHERPLNRIRLKTLRSKWTHEGLEGGVNDGHRVNGGNWGEVVGRR